MIHVHFGGGRGGIYVSWRTKNLLKAQTWDEREREEFRMSPMFWPE